MSSSARTSTRLDRAARCLTPRRIRAHALILAVCLWTVCAVDFATPALFDRAGNIKFQDFLQFPISARLIAQGRSDELYNHSVLADAVRKITGTANVDLKYFYGPQVALAFIPLGRFSFLNAALMWVAFSLFLYFACVYLIWKRADIHSHLPLVTLCALAYPSVLHFFVRGQLSALPLLFITAAYLAFRSNHEWLAGIALGFLVFKPQFLVAIPFALLAARAWRILAGLVISAAAQLGLTYLYFGQGVMRAYFTMLLHSAHHPASTELSRSAIQMHSLYSFFELLIPWPPALWILYLLSSFIVIALAALIWKSSRPLSLRFSALILAAVLVNPHIYIYDLLALTPAFLLLAGWSIQNHEHPLTPHLRVLLYLAFLLPFFGPLAHWTHLQLSVPIFAALLWIIYLIATPARRLPSTNPALYKPLSCRGPYANPKTVFRSYIHSDLHLHPSIPNQTQTHPRRFL